MSLKINVSSLLGKHKMTMKELSNLTGIRPNTISNLYYEEAKRIELWQIEALCEALDCDVCDIFEYHKDNK